MRISRANVLSLGFVVASFVMAAALYSRLPEMVPTHWNAQGEVDGYMPKPWGALGPPVLTAGIYLLLLVLPRISPKGYGIARFQGVYDLMQSAIVAFLFLMTGLMLLAGIGVSVPVPRVVSVAIGLLFVVLGNFMGKFTKNFFCGIRTPWTLASDEVWLRTHRLGGRLFVLAGLVCVASGLFDAGPIPLVASIAVAAAVPIFYSYVLYRRLEGDGPRQPPEDNESRHST